MQALVDILQAELHSLDILLYRLTVLGLVLGGGDLRHIRRATADAEVARQHLREVELLRATTLLEEAPTPWTTPVTVRQLAATASDPWAGMLRDLHEALSALVSEVEVAGHQSAQQAHSALHELARDDQTPLFPPEEAALGRTPAGGGTGTVTRMPPERAAGTTWRPVPFDDRLDPDDEDLVPLTAERTLHDALVASGHLRVPSLLAFLR